MKAEHRKELQTNVLADRLGRLAQRMRDKPSSRGLMIGAVVVGCIILFVGWKIYRSSVRSADSALWMKLEQASSSEDADDLASKNPSTMQGKLARFEEARTLLQSGIEGLLSDPTGKDRVSKAASLYESLAKQSKDYPILSQQALMGLGQAREAIGNFEGAVGAYEILKNDYPQSALGKQAAERIKKIQDNRKSLESLFTELKQQAPLPPPPKSGQ